MEQKTLGEIARDTWLAGTGPLYVEWDRISDAIVAAHEARRWKPWPPCVDGGLPDVVALDDPKLGRKFGFLRATINGWTRTAWKSSNTVCRLSAGAPSPPRRRRPSDGN